MTWSPIDDRSARAVLTDRRTTACLVFHFNDPNEVARVEGERSFTRGDGASEYRPWLGYWRSYDERDGVRVPTEREVAWVGHGRGGGKLLAGTDSRPFCLVGQQRAKKDRASLNGESSRDGGAFTQERGDMGAALLVFGLVVVLSVQPVKNLLSKRQVMNTSFDPLHLVNTYGAFGSITKTRYQLVIEGTRASNPDEADWREYEFKGQPVGVEERSPQWAPYHLRLDWQLWFAAMRPRPGPRQRWFFALLEALLDGDEALLGLFEHNPFPDARPEAIRVLRYRFRYTTLAERVDTGEWWRRERVGVYVPPLSQTDRRAGTVSPWGRYL